MQTTSLRSIVRHAAQEGLSNGFRYAASLAFILPYVDPSIMDAYPGVAGAVKYYTSISGFFIPLMTIVQVAHATLDWKIEQLEEKQ